ncbi:hypothetical protein E2C01_091006 [Portunus trituberculatus]|uniref:Uncharacterized protein n=1 Tax=Portunus trituberculatus TaxID=210409 RepID=A0A5B7JG87_PORTR|nr:hypothetical protein [Portunus trituberculatus]
MNHSVYYTITQTSYGQQIHLREAASVRFALILACLFYGYAGITPTRSLDFAPQSHQQLYIQPLQCTFNTCEDILSWSNIQDLFGLLISVITNLLFIPIYTSLFIPKRNRMHYASSRLYCQDYSNSTVLNSQV